MKRLSILFVMILCISVNVFAGDHPEANFGIYGIQHLPTVALYQQIYIGQVVQYIPEKTGGGYNDDYFLNAGGKFNTDYIISKIKGNDKRMTWVLLEKGTKKKIRIVINNQEYYSYNANYRYCITDTYSVPLLLSEKFEADKSKYIGKVYPEKADIPIKLEVVDIFMQEQDNSFSNSHKYPKVCFVLKDKVDGKKIIYYDKKSIDDLNDLGKVFTNPKFKCTYTVVNVFKKKKYNYKSHREELMKFYTVKNSIDGTTKDVEAASAQSEVFKYDDSRKFIAVLSKVEKPSNPAVRYGKTTNVTEKDITKYSYEDNFIDILIFAGGTQFSFILKNVSDNTLKVVWNEAVFVDVDGSASRVMHKGTKYSQREADQPASTIIKGAKIEDLVTPTDRIYYSEKLKDWTSKSLYENAKQNVENQTIKLMLPIQVKDVVNEYIFEFTLSYVYNHPEYIAK